MSLIVERLFGVATLQTLPRPGLRAVGVPPGGAFDLESFKIANLLMGNSTDAACIELALCHLEVRATEDTWLAWVGAGASQSTLRVAAGSLMQFKSPVVGCRNYIAMAGGVRCTSTSLFRGGSLEPQEARATAQVKISEIPVSFDSSPIRITQGPHSQLFDSALWRDQVFEVTPAMDRVGIRLRSEVPFPHSHELTSEAATPGAIQITRDGHAIILGPDGPTIGGYPKIGFVVQSDLSRVGQLRPGHRLQFELVTVQQAVELNSRQASKHGRFANLVNAALEAHIQRGPGHHP